MKNREHNYRETIREGLRLYRGLFLNGLGIKTPLFGGHKLTYNCNLKCKMCPFWKRPSRDLSTQQEKEILNQIFDAGLFAIGLEGGEPLLREDLPEILAYSRSLPLHTNLVTNGTLLKFRIDEIAPYLNGILFVSLDGLAKTHDQIRGVNGCFKQAVQGITEAKGKASVTINTTIQSDNIHEIEDMAQLAKDLGVRITFSLAHEYNDIEASVPQVDEIKKVAKRLLELKKKGYPIFNSTNYFKVMAKEKTWKCKPWAVINIGVDGQLVLPCYVHNQYKTSTSVFENRIKEVISSYDWKATQNCVKCNLQCYVEPSLVLSGDLRSIKDWASPVKPYVAK